MGEPKFTPGPWSAYRVPEGLGDYRIMAEDYRIGFAYTAFSKGDAKANAHLISAAPELYAVVERHAEYLQAELSRVQPKAGHICGPEGNCDSDCEARYYLSLDLAEVRSVLAKARGGNKIK